MIDERWRFIVDGLSRFAGRQLALDAEVYRSASETNFVNRSIANLLQSRGALSGDPADAVDLYTRQSSLAVSARDLATMGATLALGGVNPLTGERVVNEETCRHVLAVMTTAGLYQTSGDWLYDVGLPGKSGDRRGNHHSRPRQRRACDLRASARRGGKQRARATCRTIPVARARAGHLHVTGRRSRNRHLMWPDWQSQRRS
jgi:hypothetical protein